jgi:hypothetical protein
LLDRVPDDKASATTVSYHLPFHILFWLTAHFYFFGVYLLVPHLLPNEHDVVAMLRHDLCICKFWSGTDGCWSRTWTSCEGIVAGVFLCRLQLVTCGCFYLCLILHFNCLQAAEETGRKLKIYAVEKNPNAVVTLHVSSNGSYYVLDYACQKYYACVCKLLYIIGVFKKTDQPIKLKKLKKF